MSHLDDALAIFAVSAWANDDRSVEMAGREIDDYVLRCAGDGQEPLDALQALDAAYVGLMLDSATAKAIRLALKQRIALAISSTLSSSEEGARTTSTVNP